MFLARLFQYLSSLEASGTGSFLSRRDDPEDPLQVQSGGIESEAFVGEFDTCLQSFPSYHSERFREFPRLVGRYCS